MVKDLRFLCAEAVNDTWFYSVHWGKREVPWQIEAKKDMMLKYSELKRRLEKLAYAIDKLDEDILFRGLKDGN
jgi:hypothetical protein